MAKAACNKVNTVLSWIFQLNLKHKLVKCQMRIVAIGGAETWHIGMYLFKYF
jgi:hypothetical protein